MQWQFRVERSNIYREFNFPEKNLFLVKNKFEFFCNKLNLIIMDTQLLT